MYILCKLLYISIFGLLSAAPPYLSIYYHDTLGFTSNQIGLVLAIAPFIQSVACPLWTILVDKKPNLHGFIMSFTSLLGGIAVMGILLLGHLVSNPSIQISTSTLVLFISILQLAFAFFTLPNTSLVDSAVMKILGPNKILYGEQRLWGSISAGLTILLVGQLISMTNNLDIIFYVFGLATLSFVTFALFVKVDQYELDEQVDDHNKLFLHESYPHNANTPITKMLSEEKPINNNNNHRNQSMNYQSIPTSTTQQHHYGYLDDEFQPYLHKSTTNQSMLSVREEAEEALDVAGVDLGLAISRISSVDQSMAHLLDDEDAPSLSILTSVRVLTFLASTLLLGVSLSMIVNFLFLFQGIIIAHLATVIRCIGYTLLSPDQLSTNVLALVLQTLHGIGFGIFWATAVSEIDGFFPPEQRSVAQGILGALHAGLGTGLGALIGGYLYDYYSPIFLFQTSAFLCIISIGIFSVGRLPRFNVN
ncbi:major facilitator superfamily domain-containing protein [Cunninghamella echinulata]|nr:major facilitator superfamily domain-containing protein [Cunninghamella echinulata]